MLEEMNAINDNEMWELTTLSGGHHAIGMKWVYKVKHDKVGDVVRHKALLVAIGYVQHAGIDFDEVFAPVARLESMQMMLALATHGNWKSITWTSKVLSSTTRLRRRSTFNNHLASSSLGPSTRYCVYTSRCTNFAKH
jgi:hypothetical protein